MARQFLTQTPIAHRGLHGEGVPENSMRAFEAAAEAGYPIETDVRLTKDGELTLFHDDNLVRMTGVNKKMIDCTAEELKNYLLAGTDPIPLFNDFIKTFSARVPLLLEIKPVPEADGFIEAFITQISDALSRYRGEYAVQSFHPLYVQIYKKLHPEICCGLLAGAATPKEFFTDFGTYDFLSFAFSDYPTSETEAFTGAKLAWTVRSAEDEQTARKYADNIIFEHIRPKH